MFCLAVREPRPTKKLGSLPYNAPGTILVDCHRQVFTWLLVKASPPSPQQTTATSLEEHGARVATEGRVSAYGINRSGHIGTETRAPSH